MLPALLSRSAVVTLLGISRSTVIRAEERGELSPVLSATGRETVYARDDVEAYARKHKRGFLTAGVARTGEEVARVFDLLEDGLPHADIVRQLRMTPDEVEAHSQRWRESSRTRISFTRKQVRNLLEMLEIDAREMPDTAKEVLERIEGQLFKVFRTPRKQRLAPRRAAQGSTSTKPPEAKSTSPSREEP